MRRNKNQWGENKNSNKAFCAAQIPQSPYPAH